MRFRATSLNSFMSLRFNNCGPCWGAIGVVCRVRIHTYSLLRNPKQTSARYNRQNRQIFTISRLLEACGELASCVVEVETLALHRLVEGLQTLAAESWLGIRQRHTLA